MINKHKLAGILAALVLVSGCEDSRILETTGFIHSASYDWLPNGNINYAVSVPVANPDIKTSSARLFLQTEAVSGKAARIKLSRHSNLLLVSGQLRTALFGINLAKNDIWTNMDTLMRDPTISEKVKVVIVNGNAGSLLSRNFPAYPRTGKYIDRLIDKEAAGHTIPVTTIYSFARDYYDDGIDPIAPIIKDAGDNIVIDGIALFSHDKYVGKIYAKNAIIFSLLQGDFKQGELSINLSEGKDTNNSIMISAINSSRKLHVKHDNYGQIQVNIQVNATASILEYRGSLELNDNNQIKKLEKEMSEHITQRAEQILQVLQKKKVDSLGLGKHVRNSMTYRAWKQLDWKSKYPDIKIQCSINLKIREHGFI